MICKDCICKLERLPEKIYKTNYSHDYVLKCTARLRGDDKVSYTADRVIYESIHTPSLIAEDIANINRELLVANDIVRVKIECGDDIMHLVRSYTTCDQLYHSCNKDVWNAFYL